MEATKEQYEEMAAEIIRLTQVIGQEEVRKEVNYTVLRVLSEVIGDFDSGVDKMVGQRKTNAENAIKKLHYVFIRIGKLFQDEMIAKMKLYKAQKENLELAGKVSELQARVETLESMGQEL